MNHVRKLLPFVRPYWRRALLALVLLTALVFLDLSIPRLIQRIIDQGIMQQDQQVVVRTSILMLVISALSTLIAIGNNVTSVRVGESVARDLREAQFLKIQSYSFGDLDRQRTGQLMVRLTSDTTNFQRLVQISLRIGTRAPMLMVGSLILMINTSPRLALALSPVLLVTMFLIVFFIRRMEPFFRAVQQKLDRLNTVLQENIAGARLVKAFVRAPYEAERFEDANETYTVQSVKVMRFMSTMGPALTVFVNIGMVIVIWYGGLRVIGGQMTVGQIVAFTNYLMTTMTPLIMMTMLSQTWAQGMVSARRINEILDTVPEVQNAADAVPLPADARPAIVFHNVEFHYNGYRQQAEQPADGGPEAGASEAAAEEAVLEGIDLVVEPGQTVAILGATGAGKTTLVNLVPRFYDVSAGRVTVGGADVRGLRRASLLEAIAIVPQEALLFSGTVADNIRYGAPNASNEEVVAAAKASQAHDFIMEMPEGYASQVAPRGANLSGGQKQRIAIARALLMKPKILILDDSTSAVDVETETRIQDALEAQMREHSTLVVAQRISTVLKADKIVVIDLGRIAAEGTHKELMRSSPIYREIYDSQLGGGLADEDGRLQDADVGAAVDGRPSAAGGAV
jgi:ATP-binding cassette, subfamily B, multidrug efflux pump